MADEAWRVPTPVHELTAGVVEPPSQFVQKEQDRPQSLLPAADIPVIDLSRLSDADEASKLQSALQTWGLFLATNHGIEASLMDELMTASRDFFHQPLQEKQKYSRNLLGGKRFQLEGYGNEMVSSKDQILDWQDLLQLMVEPEDDRNLAYWPKHPESFRDLLHEYASKTKKIRDNLLRAMGKILELGEDYFISEIGEKAYAVARFSYYPPCPRPELVFGLKPHSDGGALTILLVHDDVGGLQVQKDGIWYTVPSKPHTLVVNLADSMEIMNNGIFKSPVHRVVTNAEKERLSLAVFYGVEEGEKMLEPAAGLLGEDRPARYRKIKAADYMVGLRQGITKGQRFMETLKI